MSVRIAALALLFACTGCANARGSGPSQDPYVAAFRRLHPSVVFFTMHVPAEDPKRKGKWDEAYGSGVVVESGSWGSRVITDAHVIADARDLVATIGDGPHARARVIAMTGEDDDLAIVDVPLKNQTPAKLGSITGIAPGTAIGVLGYPIPDAFEDERLGRTASLYTGRVASVRPGALELDVPIIPGESGGPVFDAESGEVIGIAESRFDEERAIGFATPIDTATRFLASHPRLERASRR